MQTASTLETSAKDTGNNLPSVGGEILPPPRRRRRAPTSLQLKNQLHTHLPVFYPQGGSFTAIRHTSSSQLEGEERERAVKLSTHLQVGEKTPGIAELAPLGLLVKRNCSEEGWRGK